MLLQPIPIIDLFVCNHRQLKLQRIHFKIIRNRNSSDKQTLGFFLWFFSELSLDNRRRLNDDVFLDLTTDYNRKRFVQSDLVNNAIKNINQNISERLSLLILTAAARCVHHVTPERRVELLEEVILCSNFDLPNVCHAFLRLGKLWMNEKFA